LSETPPREFEPVTSASEALGLVREGAKTLSSATLWTKNQERVVNTHLSVYSESTDSFYCWTPKDLDPKIFMDEIAKIAHKGGETDIFFSVSLQRANIFFKTKFMDFDQAGLRFKLPTKVYKVQRRKELRFPIPDSISLKVEFNDPLSPGSRSSRKVGDISAGGMSFLINEDELPMFPTGLKLEDFSFTIRSRKITVAAEIRHSRKIPGINHARNAIVGVLFKDIRPGDSQHIAGYVFEESRKYFSRFI
jgi:c-di-GMP-binding flagellar brake protein YcgR